METKVTTWSEFLNERKATAEQIQGSKEINSKEQDYEKYSQESE